MCACMYIIHTTLIKSLGLFDTYVGEGLELNSAGL